MAVYDDPDPHLGSLNFPLIAVAFVSPPLGLQVMENAGEGEILAILWRWGRDVLLGLLLGLLRLLLGLWLLLLRSVLYGLQGAQHEGKQERSVWRGVLRAHK